MPRDNVNSNENTSSRYNYNSKGEKKEAIFTQVRNNSDGSREMLTQRYDVKQVESHDTLKHKSTTYSGYSSSGNLYAVTTKSISEKNKNK